MADFTIDVSRSKTSRINLGIQGENIIEHIIFDISGWIEEFGEGVAYIYAQRKGDENPYPVALDMDLDAGTATWTITDADTAIKGKGKAQLVFVSDDEDSITDVEVYSSSSTYSVGDYCLYGTQLYKCKTTISTAEAWTPAHWDAVNEVKKTRVYATTVQASLVSTSSENPDAYETWLEVLGGYTARIEAAEDELEDYVQNNTIADVTLNSTSIVEDRVAEIPLASSSGHGAMSSTDKAKLDGIEAGAEVNVQADWNQSDNTADDYIKNKPTIPDVPDIEGTSPINVDDTTDTLIISHEVSAVTPGTYGGYNGTDMSGYYCFYAPTFTVDDDGHLTFASNLGENVSDVLNPSSSYGFIRKEVWAGAVRAYLNNYILAAGQTSSSFDIYDSNSPWTSVGIVDVVAFDATTYEPVMVDWTVDTLASVSIKQPYVTLTVSIAEAYEHDIRIYPTVTYRIIGM